MEKTVEKAILGYSPGIVRKLPYVNSASLERIGSS